MSFYAELDPRILFRPLDNYPDQGVITRIASGVKCEGGVSFYIQEGLLTSGSTYLRRLPDGKPSVTF